MSLFTTHIGWAIKDFLEGRDIQGEPANRADPYMDEMFNIEKVDIQNADNPVIYTTGGVFKVIIIRVDPPSRPVQKLIEG